MITVPDNPERYPNQKICETILLSIHRSSPRNHPGRPSVPNHNQTEEAPPTRASGPGSNIGHRPVSNGSCTRRPDGGIACDQVRARSRRDLRVKKRANLKFTHAEQPLDTRDTAIQSRIRESHNRVTTFPILTSIPGGGLITAASLIGP